MTSNHERADLAVRVLTWMFNDHDTSVIEEYISASYIQHNPLIPNGREPVSGFVGSLGDAPKIIEPARAVAEGDFAAVHSHYAWTPEFELNGGPARPSSTSSDSTPATSSSNTGTSPRRSRLRLPVATPWSAVPEPAQPPPARLRSTPNKAAIERLFDAFSSGDTNAFDELISSQEYIQHNPQVANGLQPVKEFFDGVGPLDVDLVRLIASGDLVFAHAHYKTLGTAAVDIFRFAEGRKIVEHWDVHQPVPESTASGNDMFSQLT
jgi:predicted SnoaL-like aldol condensation-catalyzing enzyme